MLLRNRASCTLPVDVRGKSSTWWISSGQVCWATQWSTKCAWTSAIDGNRVSRPLPQNDRHTLTTTEAALQLNGFQLSVPGVLWDEHQVPVGRITDIDSVVPLKVTVGADASPRQFGVQIVSPLPADRRKGQAGAALCVAGEGLEDHHFQTPLGKVVGRRSWRRRCRRR